MKIEDFINNYSRNYLSIDKSNFVLNKGGAISLPHMKLQLEKLKGNSENILDSYEFLNESIDSVYDYCTNSLIALNKKIDNLDFLLDHIESNTSKISEFDSIYLFDLSSIKNSQNIIYDYTSKSLIAGSY